MINECGETLTYEYFSFLQYGDNARVIDLIETKQVSMNEKSIGRTALHIVLETNNFKLLEFLISQPDIDPNLKTS